MRRDVEPRRAVVAPEITGVRCRVVLDPRRCTSRFFFSPRLGMLKIMSKMGISLLSSYHGAQIFEAIGIGDELLGLAFRGTPSRLGGMRTEDLAHETVSFVVSTRRSRVWKGTAPCMAGGDSQSEPNVGGRRSGCRLWPEPQTKLVRFTS